MTAEVVQLFPGEATEDLAPIRRDDEPSCQHQHIRLDVSARRVFCRDCSEETDPFDFLLKLSREWDRWERAEAEAKRRSQAASTRLEETLRLERNARARVKRRDPKAKLPTVPWGHSTV